MDEPEESASQSGSEHYREMAGKLRDLARRFGFPRARRELRTLASRFERRADQLEAQSAPAASDHETH